MEIFTMSLRQEHCRRARGSEERTLLLYRGTRGVTLLLYRGTRGVTLLLYRGTRGEDTAALQGDQRTRRERSTLGRAVRNRSVGSRRLEDVSVDLELQAAAPVEQRDEPRGALRQ
ncbi:hypothetical protein EYF80_059554 [Liparis tanakae]|uniref:Uncharacterized protein n=1 Tax=Liparis tanakae TaxID=230148 RepID=A0A4Z2EPP1_9TELE|nr:hypothetical protein EYF80_059554 [Liparis tanakae]